MAINLGTNTVGKSFLGNGELNSIYLGTNLIYQKITEQVSSGRLYAVNSGTPDTLMELDPSTLAIINSNTQNYAPYSMGGIAGKLFSIDQSTDTIYEHDINTLIATNTVVNNSAILAYGLGGTATKLYALNTSTTGGFLKRVYEVDPSTLLLTNALGNIPASAPRGLGGTYSRLYATDSSNYIYEVDTNTGLAINTSTVFNPDGATLGNLRDIEGINGRLYVSDINSDFVYEIDPNTFNVLNRSIKQLDSGMGAVVGVGGTKALLPNLYNIVSMGFNYYPDPAYTSPTNTINGDEITVNVYSDGYTVKGFTVDLELNTRYLLSYNVINARNTSGAVYFVDGGFTFNNRATYNINSFSYANYPNVYHEFTTSTTTAKHFIGLSTSGATGGAIVKNLSLVKKTF